jgi:hypothetical protein
MQANAMSTTMPMMEHAENTIAVPPLVDDDVLQRFCLAVQAYADGSGLTSRIADRLFNLRAKLANLKNLATLCRFAVLGHPNAFHRLDDELYCIAEDFPCDPIEIDDCCCGGCDDEPEPGIDLTAAVDLFAGAAFVCNDDLCRRDRYIIGIVRAIEDAVSFPSVYSAEAAAYLDPDNGELAPQFVAIVIGNAAGRLVEGDQRCVPRLPRSIRHRLRCLAVRWMRANPVTEFLKALSGPKIKRILRWQETGREAQCSPAHFGDPLILLLKPDNGADKAEVMDATPCCEDLQNLGVMFCPHQPAQVVGASQDALEVRVPEGAVTGPIAVVPKVPDFSPVWTILHQYVKCNLPEMSGSVFANVRMDVWCYPFAFGPPCLAIVSSLAQFAPAVFGEHGRLNHGDVVAVGENVAFHLGTAFSPNDARSPISMTAIGGVVTTTGRPGVLLFRATKAGNGSVAISRAYEKIVVPIKVVPSRKGEVTQ